MSYASPPHVQALLDQLVAATKADLNRAALRSGGVPPCPSWCGLPAGHPYEAMSDWMPVVLERLHVKGGPHVEVAQIETNTEGVVELFDPELNLRTADGLEPVDLLMVRALLEELPAVIELFGALLQGASPPKVVPSGPAPAWAGEISAFLVWQRACGIGADTVNLRRLQLNRLAAALRGVPPFLVTTDDLAGWLGAQTNWGSETRRSHRLTLRRFYEWAAMTGRTKINPAINLPAIRVPPGVPRPAPDFEIKIALASAEPRVRVMILLGACCGLRRAEIARVHIDDVQDGELRVLGKGGRVRIIPIPPIVEQAVRALAMANDAAWGGPGRVGWLFPSSQAGVHRKRGEGFIDRGAETAFMTPAHVGKLMTRILGPGWTAHTLRHRFGSVAYMAERDLLAVQQLLGHSKPETTQRYVRVTNDSLRRAVDLAAIIE